jgi:hypothetical protein
MPNGTEEPQAFNCPDPAIRGDLSEIKIGVKDNAKHLMRLTRHVEDQNTRIDKLEWANNARIAAENAVKELSERWFKSIGIAIALGAILISLTIGVLQVVA